MKKKYLLLIYKLDFNDIKKNITIKKFYYIVINDKLKKI